MTLSTSPVFPAYLNVVLLVVRVFLGGMIFAHGYRKFFGGGKLKGTAGWFESIGMRQPALNALLAASTEVGVGVLLVVGFLTPFASAGLIALMTTAIITVHWKNGFFIFNKGEGIEYTLAVAVMSLVPATFGAGKFSLDHVANLTYWTSTTRFWIAVLLGVGGSVAQVATFFRPSK